LALAWCAYMLMVVLRDGASTLVQAGRGFRVLALSNGVAAIVTGVAVLSLTPAIGAVGAILGTATGEAILAALLWRRAVSNFRQAPPPGMKV
jgi:O-antigen/teichoic acid export membrane protein